MKALVLVLISLVTICKSIMDVCAFTFEGSLLQKWGLNPQWWNHTLSWTNKHWFIWFMDAWHFFQGVGISLAIVAMILYGTVKNKKWLTDLILISATYLLTWWVVYEWILKL